MFKHLMLAFMMLILISTVCASGGIEFHLEVPAHYYQPYEEIPVEVSITNYEQIPKNITLVVEVGSRKFKFDYPDVKSNQRIVETVKLPPQMPGRQVVKGRIYYEDAAGEPVMQSVPDDIEILFPKEIPAYPKKVIIVTFDLPEKLYGGKGTIIQSNVKNEGDFDAHIVVELGSYDEFQSTELVLKPGETKMISLNETFYSTGISFLESRVYYIEGDRKYLVNYFAKEVVVTDEKIADLRFDHLELYLESDQETNQNDEVKLRVHILNKGKFPAMQAVGHLSGNIAGLSIVKSSVKYETISPRLVTGGETAEDYFEIKTENVVVQNATLSFTVEYTDNQERKRSFTVPLRIFPGHDKCLMNWDCKEGFVCNEESECQKLICSCGDKTEHLCVNLTDAKCTDDQKCDIYGTCLPVSCQCGQVIGHKCVLPDDARCPSDKRCGVTGMCEDIFCPGGKIENHLCDYKCSADSDCGEGEVCNAYNRCELGCRDDSNCKSTQKCNEISFCEDIECSCGEIQNRQCVKYACCSNEDCGEFEDCSPTIHQCVTQTGCVGVVEQGGPNDKADILFIGSGFSSYQELKEKIQQLLDQNNNGLFSVEPFKSNPQIFNIWMTLAPDFRYEATGGSWKNKAEDAPAESGERFVSRCPFVDYPIVLSEQANYRSYAHFGGMVYLSLPGYDSSMQGRLLLHEFGHSFGQLKDEYTEPGAPNVPGEPNCAPTEEIASRWWGDLAQTDPSVSVRNNLGCSYVPNNIRPTANSIMRIHTDLKNDYGSVNLRALTSRVRAITGSGRRDFKSPYPLIFLHGWGGDVTSFSEMQDTLETDGISPKMLPITPSSSSRTVCPDQNWNRASSTNFDYYTSKQEWLDSENAGIEEYGKRLSKAIDVVKHCAKSDRVILIAHSMGGLVARSYMSDYGVDSVDKVITLATPHYGAELSDGGKDAEQMRPNSEFLRELNSMDCENRGLIIPIAARNLLEKFSPDKENSSFVDGCFAGTSASDSIVSEGSAKLKGGKEPHIVECKHTDLAILDVGGVITSPSECPFAYRIVKEELR